MANWKVPLADLDLAQEEIDAVSKVLRSRWLSMGPVTAEFEQRFAEFVGVKYAFAVTNGTAALHLAHLALGAGPGDTVICPSLTFVATANAIRYTGAAPIFADCTSVDNLNISPDDIEAKIEESTKGICVMHYGGYPCDMERIMQIARRHNLYVVEDAAHAPGAACWMTNGETSPSRRELRNCGSIGDIGCFSFFSNKNLTTGEGGMITTDSDMLAEKIKLLRSHGMTSLTWDRDKGHSFSYDVVDLGYNYRIDEIRSAIGLVQLKKLNGSNEKRTEYIKIYKENLYDIDLLSFIFNKDYENTSSNHIFVILLNINISRKKFMDFMKEKSIQTSIHYPPIHKFSYNVSNKKFDLKIVNDIEKRLITLPLYPDMGKEKIDYTVKAIRSALL